MHVHGNNNKEVGAITAQQKIENLVGQRSLPYWLDHRGIPTKVLWEVSVPGIQKETGRITVTVTVTDALVLRPPTRRPRTHHRVNPYDGDRRQNETEMFSVHGETSPSIAAVSAPSVA